MELLLYLTLGLIFCGVYLALAGLYGFVFQDRILVGERVARLQKGKVNEGSVLREELRRPVWERLGKPLWDKLSQLFTRRMGAEKRHHFQRRLQAAGNPAGLDPGEFRLVQYLCALCLGGAGAGLGRVLGFSGLESSLPLLVGVILGAFSPELYLGFRIKERRAAVMRGLPDVLDLLTVSVEAGLGFEIALVKVTERFQGVLAEEFGRVLQEMKLGKPRREALKDMAERVGAEDLTTFVGALTQADQLGVSIGNILRLQAGQMRRKRRQRAEEQAMQAPVKMLLPLVFFIFPALFVVLLGPALIQIMRHL
ncbi:MAG: type II secretion system F family protein [Bacillota bacterium]|nr:type II secretion system F family protein [Bacillota bacterium]